MKGAVFLEHMKALWCLMRKLNILKRNEERFKQFGYNDHQNTVSPLTEIGIGVFNLFPLDYMHLVCLGAV